MAQNASRPLAKAAQVALALVILGTSPMAMADLITAFSGSGTSGIDGRPQNASAMFASVNMGGGTFSLTITLENTAGPGQLGGVSSVLYGLVWEMSGGGTLSLSSATASGAVDCSSGTCQSVAAPTILWTYGSGQLLAPLPEQGIVNNNIVTTDGIPNAQHNPYLLGPVAFTFLLTGGPIDGDPLISNVMFRFGTGDGEFVGGGCTDGGCTQVPEPGTLALLGFGIIGIGLSRRRKKA